MGFIFKRPFFVSAFLALLSSFAVLYFGVIAAICLIAFGILTVILGFTFCKINKYTIQIVLVGISVFVVSVNALYTFNVKIKSVDDNLSNDVRFDCIITEMSDSDSAVGYVTDGDLSSGVKIKISECIDNVEVGDCLSVTGKLHSLNNDMKGYYYSNGIYANVSADNMYFRRYIKNPLRFIANLRVYISQVFNKNLKGTEADFINALCIGSTEGLSSDFNDCVRDAGVSHIIVVSGMHLCIICGAFFKFLRRLRVPLRLTSIFTSLTAIIIVALCGFGFSAIRAGIVYIILSGGIFLGRRTDALNSLGAAVCAILAFSPFAAGSVSLLLSVSATFGLIVFTPLITNIIGGENISNKLVRKVVLSLRDNFAVSLSAYICTLPIIIFVFNRVSLVAIITNLLTYFVVNSLLCLSVTGVVLSFSIPFTKLIFFIVQHISGYVVFIIELLGSPQAASIYVDRAFALPMLIAVAAIYIILKLVNRRVDRIKKEKEGDKANGIIEGTGIKEGHFF